VRDPQAIYDEARSYRPSYEPERKELPPGLTNEDLEELYYTALDGRAADVARLETMVKRFPEVPSLWNYLTVAHRVRGKEKKARAVERRLLERHPDYLFAKVAEARNRCASGRAASVPEVLGESMTLREALGHDRPPHLSEWKHFYGVVVEWHIEEGRLDHAAKLLDAIKSEDHTEEEVEVLGGQLAAARFMDFRRRMERDEKKRVRVKQGKVPKVRERTPRPVGLSEPVEALYRHDLGLPPETIEAVLALPRERAVSELRLVLKDAIDNGPHLHHFARNYGEEEIDFGLHALWLLGELRAAEAIPDVLDFLSQNERVLGDLFGDVISWQPLVGFVDGDLSVLAEWMKRPGLSSVGRGALSEAVAMVAATRPELRDAAVSFLREVLEAMRDGEAGDGVLDTDLVSQMVADAVMLQAVELEGLLRDLYARGLVLETFAGPLENVLADLELPQKPPPLPTMEEFYAQLLESSRSSDRSELADPEDLLEPDAPAWPPQDIGREPAAPAAIKVGRNDPCPCGSGKKYKKCCMN